MPDPKRFVTHVGLTQSPESVALRYKVPIVVGGTLEVDREVLCVDGPVVRTTSSSRPSAHAFRE